jgi:hypothetical protein
MIPKWLIGAALISLGANVAHADSIPYIGVQFVDAEYGPAGPTLGSTDSAGLIPQEHYNTVYANQFGSSGTYVGNGAYDPVTGNNDINDNTPVTALNDASGTPTAVGLTDSGDTNDFSTGTGNSTLNAVLLANGNKAGGNSESFTFTNVPAGEYDLIAYIECDYASSATFAVGGTQYSVDLQAGSAYAGSFIDAATNTSGNYVEFDGISPDGSSDITITGTNLGGQASVNGIQLLSVVPEPASLSLLSLGAFGLLARRRRCA